jgi:hypothetical protein
MEDCSIGFLVALPRLLRNWILFGRVFARSEDNTELSKKE